MSLIEQLSSQTGDRSEQSNRGVAQQCLDDPGCLAEIAGGLASADPGLAGDCAEVMTMVAAKRPEYIVPFIEPLAVLLDHPKTRLRWEAAHAVALTAGQAVPFVQAILPKLHVIIRSDLSTIVRDYAVDAVGGYAGVGPSAAQEANPILRESLAIWAGKHARQALEGLGKTAASTPILREEIRALVQPYLEHPRSSVRRAALAAWKAAQ